MNALIWSSEDLGASWDVVDIPADLADKAAEYRDELMNVLSDIDDDLAEKYLGEEEITPDEIRAVIRRGTIANQIVPVLTGSAYKNKGVQPMLDAVVSYMPSPLDLPAIQGTNLKGEEDLERQADDTEPFSALAFKIMTDPTSKQKLTYARVYSGKLEKGDAVLNARSGDKERAGRILQMHAMSQEERDSAVTGDIVALIGMKNTRTGDTLSDPSNPIVLEAMTFPETVVDVAVEPKSKADQDKMGKALASLSEEDPTFRVRTDEETGQTVISGMGELHLDILIDRMLREFKVEASVGKPQVAYRETITKPVKGVQYRHKKQTGGSGQFADVIVDLEPTGPGGGYEFADQIKGGVIPKEYIPSVDHGFRDAMTNGVLAGFPTVDVKCSLVDGSYHDVDSSEMAFKIAGQMVFREAVRAAGPVILEPIMKVEVTTPEDYMGDVIGDLNSRRGRVGQMESRGNSQVIDAEVPLSEMFGYANDLRSKTQGRANYSMQFGSYQEVPKNVSEEIIARIRGE